MRVIDYLLQPTVLQRIDENPQEASGATMSLSDLFDWLHAGIYGGLSSNDIPLVRRNLQAAYAAKLSALVATPAKDVPSDAIALARAQLQIISRDAQRALRSKHDAVTAAHLTSLLHNANAALK
jgi:hypothetical protein